MQKLAQRDPLTGLANRAYLREQLGMALGSETPGTVAVLWIELGKFQEINDLHGQPVGDALLQAIAARLRTCVGDQAIIARKEGDRFIVVQIGEEQPAAAAGLASRITDGLRPPYEINGSIISVEPRIGIAVSPADGKETDPLLSNAKTALQRAKSGDHTPYQFFAPEIDREAKARRALETDLGNALRNNEFEVHYQPLVNLATRSLIGCEALLRWHRPGYGSVSPAQFIPIAETSGLIFSIGEWVLRQACRDAVTWPSHLKIAVNMSGIQFTADDLVHTVTDILRESGLQPTRLELEITESIFLADSQKTLATLRQLKATGVHISMDDFGTGYSSLSYLRRFPFDTIKIDRSFIRDLSGEDPSSRIIMHAVSRMGASLGIATLAEGIETEEQLEIARQEGCIEGQGYLFGRPESAAQFSERLRASALGGGLKKVVSAKAEHSGHRRRATTHLGIAHRE